MIVVSHLTKRYGAHLAVDDLSFRVDRGEVLGFLGPNGAGKSTTLRMLVGFLGMTSGKVEVLGVDVERDGAEARRHIGYMPEAVPLYPEMRVVEYLDFRAELKRVSRSSRRAYVRDAMAMARVTDVATRLIGTLSKGYRQRVGLADALVAKPPILVLDEPTSGLDPNQIRDVRSVLHELSGEHTVIVSTHILREVEATCSRAVVLAKGRLVAEGSIDALRVERRGTAFELVVRDAGALDPVAALASPASSGPKVDGAQAAVRAVERDDAPPQEPGTCRLRVTFREDADDAARALAVEALVARAVQLGLGVREVRPLRSSLEDVFSALTEEPAAPEPNARGPSARAPRDSGGARP